jgi:hypothetical protein
MAKIKLSSFIADMRGKINGHVASKGRYGNYLRNKVTPVNRNSVAQQGVRAAFTLITQSWKGIGEAAIKAFNDESKNYARLNIFGDNLPLSGFNLFAKLNGNLLAIGEAPISAVPAHSPVQGVTSMSCEIDTNVMTLSMPSALGAGESAIVYATPPLSAGKSFVKSEFRQIKVINTASTKDIVITTAYTDVFGVLPTSDQKCFVKIKPVGQSTGIPGPVLTSPVTHA